MEKTKELFIDAFRASLKNERVSWSGPFEDEQWALLFKLADIHHVLPMIYEAVYSCPAAGLSGEDILKDAKKQAIGLMTVQVRKTEAFLKIYKALEQAGIRPLVVKGIVLRNIYPGPDLRMSSDEDILISPEDFDICDGVFKKNGLLRQDPQSDPEKKYEISYRDMSGLVYIELHKYLFPPEQAAYGSWNEYFGHVHDNRTEIDVERESIFTMAPTDNIFYLICHAFKHFLHGGVGIRQAADIALFAQRYEEEIDWDEVLEKCEEIRAGKFVQALFKIGRKHLGLNTDPSDIPDELFENETDELPLLSDMLDAGVYGGSDGDRAYSGVVTLSAVAKKEGKGKIPILKNIFPPASKLADRYPWLEKHPVLLPVAWADRILKYEKEIENKGNSDGIRAVKAGKKRIRLLKFYDVV